jgi:O-antigen/teichoic acid export membrane protein
VDDAGEPLPGPVPATPGDAVSGAMSGLFGRDSLYMVVWILQVVTAAAMTPVTTRLLGTAEFGAVAAAIAIMQVLTAVAGFGLQVAIQRQFATAGDPEGARRLLTLCILVATAVTVLAVVTAPSWASALGLGGQQVTLRLAAAWAGAAAVTAALLGLLRSQDRLLPFVAVSVLQSVVAQAGAVALVATVDASAATFVAGQLAGQAAALTVGLVLVTPLGLRLSDRALVRSGLAFAVPLLPAMLGEFVLGASDRLLLQHLDGSTAVARYAVAYNIGSLPMLVLGALDAVWLPRFFALRDEAHRAALLAASRDALYRLAAPALLGLGLVSPLVLRLWAPPRYDTDGLLLVTSLVALSAVPYMSVLSSTRGLLSAGRTRAVAVAMVVAAVVNVGLNLLLIPAVGLDGAALATLVAFVVQAVVLRAVQEGRRRGRARAGAGLKLVLIASAAVLAVVALPATPAGLAVRGALSVAAAGWLLREYLRVVRGRPGADADGPAAPS